MLYSQSYNKFLFRIKRLYLQSRISCNYCIYKTKKKKKKKKKSCNVRIRSFGLSAFWIAKDAKFLHADNEVSNQTARMRRLIRVFVGCTCQKVRFLTFRLLSVTIITFGNQYLSQYFFFFLSMVSILLNFVFIF